MSGFREAFEAGAAELGLRFDPAVLAAFERHYLALLAGNARANLTAIVEPADAAEKHYLDSALCLEFVPDSADSLVDVGAGAGFPGLVLKLLRPGLAVALLDSQRKRTEFLREAVAALGLDRVAIAHARAEDAGRDPEWRERFDCAVARAVAPLPTLAELTMPFVAPGGLCIAMKGRDGEAEAVAGERAVRTLGGRVREVAERRLPRGDRRTFVVIEKISRTPAAFPRKAGTAARRPLT